METLEKTERRAGGGPLARAKFSITGVIVVAFLAAGYLFSAQLGLPSGVRAEVRGAESRQSNGYDIASTGEAQTHSRQRASGRTQRTPIVVAIESNNTLRGAKTSDSWMGSSLSAGAATLTPNAFVPGKGTTGALRKTGFEAGLHLLTDDPPQPPPPCTVNDLQISPSSVTVPSGGAANLAFLIGKRPGHSCSTPLAIDIQSDNGITNVIPHPFPDNDPDGNLLKVTYDVAARSGPEQTCQITSSRRIRVVVGMDSISQTVNQDAVPCRFNIPEGSPTINVSSAGKPMESFPLNNNGNGNPSCECILSVDQIRVDGDQIIQDLEYKPDNDIRHGKVTFSIVKNEDHRPKSALIRIGTDTQIVNLAEASCPITLSPPAGDPSYDFKDTGGSGTIGISSAVNGCANSWTAEVARDSRGMIEIQGGTEHASTVVFNVKQNSEKRVRIGVITIGGQTLTISQDGAATDCKYTVPQDPARISRKGGPFTFTVTTTSTNAAVCDWTATASALWIKTTSKGGTGVDKVEYTVDENLPGSPVRQALIFVGNTTFQIIQEAGEGSTPNCSFDITPPGISVGPALSSGGFNVGTTDECSWEPISSASWIHVIKTTGNGKGKGTVEFTVDTLPDGLQKREGQIAIGNQPFTITQSLPCAYTLSPTSIMIGEEPGSFSFLVSAIPTDCKWTASSDSTRVNSRWITLAQNTGKSGDPVVFTVLSNQSAVERPGEIKIDDSEVRFTVTQALKRDVETKVPACPNVVPIEIGQTIYGDLSGSDCPSKEGTARFADRYRLTIPEGPRRMVGINVSASSFDPKINVLEIKENDDGAGFSNSRVPRGSSAERFIPLEPGVSYTIEVSSFKTLDKGKYAIFISSDQDNSDQDRSPTAPTILGAVGDGRKLIVTGENFSREAAILINGVEQETKNDDTKPGNALTLVLGKKSKKETNAGCVRLQVRNADNRTSAVFVYKECL